jgi:hypothetical protein
MNNKEWIEKVTQINTHHIELHAEFLAKLKATPDGDGNLLDNSMIVYGSGLSDGNRHLHEDLPILLAGRGGEQHPDRSPHADCGRNSGRPISICHSRADRASSREDR